jgi:hypothetical protein
MKIERVKLASKATQAANAAAALALVQRFVIALEQLGFGADDDIDGADVVDTVNQFYPDLRKLARSQGR